ncbi:MAG TPA: hypothetical protein PKX38_05315 [Alphaproteobacteria bacterium]|jgi:septum formation inhibitor-activating ATPase MinD|nr:hypothetical protein [Micavibrio sp.]MBK9563583.1 hypothetical protein [Micavibrio sp.]HQX27340.1 hypothetical protein [Alphaproteobacteria bacterium]
MEIPAQFAAEQAIVRQNAAMSMIKASSDAEKKLIGILEDSARQIAASNRGNNVNVQV